MVGASGWCLPRQCRCLSNSSEVFPQNHGAGEQLWPRPATAAKPGQGRQLAYAAFSTSGFLGDICGYGRENGPDKRRLVLELHPPGESRARGAGRYGYRCGLFDSWSHRDRIQCGWGKRSSGLHLAWASYDRTSRSDPTHAPGAATDCQRNWTGRDHQVNASFPQGRQFGTTGARCGISWCCQASEAQERSASTTRERCAGPGESGRPAACGSRG
mmetsp:Transcript_34926/g.83717  ORF Transcript_34926/g.83717 Transcript_34926/m.83717 type:complete len:215 (-) Transcript_34926:1001-1645(-)